MKENNAAMLATLLLAQLSSLIVCGTERTDPVLVDPEATKETRALFINLRKLAKDKLLFGHQHTTDYGIGWKDADNRSDVLSVTGSYPAVYGWDMNVMDNPRLPKLIREAYARGGINTISWHMRNPITGGRYSDITRAVEHILPGGRKHEEFKAKLDDFVTFLGKLKDQNGRPIPIIFRPWHEHTHGAFWWCIRSCTPEEYIELWQFTVKYLRDVRSVHNLLYAYSPHKGGIKDKNSYLTNRFPGYEYMDVLGIDCYYKEDPKDLLEVSRIIVELAEEESKIPALTEVGVGRGLSEIGMADWYTKAFLEPVKTDSVARRVAYALVWRNANKRHFWVPYPGHRSVPDFKKFHADPFTVFEEDLPDVYSLPMDVDKKRKPRRHRDTEGNNH